MVDYLLESILPVVVSSSRMIRVRFSTRRLLNRSQKSYKKNNKIHIDLMPLKTELFKES